MKKIVGILMMMTVVHQLCWSQKGASISIENDAKKADRLEIEALLTDAMRFSMLEEYDRADTTFRKILKKNPNLAAADYELAKILFKQNVLDEAAIFSQKAYDLNPENKYYGLQLAEISAKQHKFSKAADIYKAIIKQSPDNAEYGFELASVYLMNDEYEEAIRAYEDIEKSTGISEAIVHQKQRIYLKLNKTDKAIAEARKLILSEPNEPQYRIELAQLLLANNAVEEAKNELENALKISPDDADARVLLAEIYKQKGDQNAATQQMGEMFNNPNADLDVKMQALAVMFQQAKDDNAKQELLTRAQEIVKAHPKEVKAHIVYADLLTKSGKKVEARNEYVKASNLDKSSFEVWGAILQLDTDLNHTDSLLVHSEQALEVFPNQGLFWYSNGIAYLIKKNYTKSIESFEESAKLSSKNKNLMLAIQAQLGDAFHGLGEHEKSDEAYEAVLKEDPQNDPVLNNFSYYLSLRKQKLDRAKEMSFSVIERNPENSTYLDTYAWVLYVQKDYVNAKKYLEKAVNTGKASPTVIEHYGDALYQVGEKEKALEQWLKAKQMGQNNPNLNRKIETKQLNEA